MGALETHLETLPPSTLLLPKPPPYTETWEDVPFDVAPVITTEHAETGAAETYERAVGTNDAGKVGVPGGGRRDENRIGPGPAGRVTIGHARGHGGPPAGPGALLVVWALEAGGAVVAAGARRAALGARLLAVVGGVVHDVSGMAWGGSG